MSARRQFVQWDQIDPAEISFTLGVDRSNKAVITMLYGITFQEVAIVTPACVTNWPRVTGDGNFGTMFGPADIHKAKFSLDLTDGYINSAENPMFTAYSAFMERIDDKLLEFVQSNQLKVLGRKNLSYEECKMLQIRTVRPKYDKQSGQLIGHSVQMTTAKYAWDGIGGKFARKINVCDQFGKVIPNGNVTPGDVVAATCYANQVYTGVGGDKFGIHWSFEDVSVICQRSKLESKTAVPVFAATQYEFAQPYEQCLPSEPMDAQFSD